MKKFLFLFCVATAMQSLVAQNAADTSTTPKPVWGYTLPENSKPLFSFWRLGLNFGGVIPTSGIIQQYPASSLRLELGLSNKFSLIADARTSVAAQVGLSAQYLFTNTSRLQPYIGAGWAYGVGNLDSLSSTIRQRGRGNNLVAQHYGTASVGVNYLIRRRLIWQTEIGYQQPIGGTDTTPAGAFRWQTGIAYQFGKKK